MSIPMLEPDPLVSRRSGCGWVVSPTQMWSSSSVRIWISIWVGSSGADRGSPAGVAGPRLDGDVDGEPDVEGDGLVEAVGAGPSVLSDSGGTAVVPFPRAATTAMPITMPATTAAAAA